MKKLPTEVKLDILSLLGPDDLLKLRSAGWEAITQTNSLWKAIVQRQYGPVDCQVNWLTTYLMRSQTVYELSGRETQLTYKFNQLGLYLTREEATDAAFLRYLWHIVDSGSYPNELMRVQDHSCPLSRRHLKIIDTLRSKFNLPDSVDQVIDILYNDFKRRFAVSGDFSYYARDEGDYQFQIVPLKISGLY